MSTELTFYERIADPLAAIKQLGNSIALSKIFNCENVAQGEVFAMECLARREPPLSLAERYHVIFGKLSMKADAMLAGFYELGGKHRQLSRTGDLASIELTIGGQTQAYSLSWEEAQQEPFVYEGKDADVIKALESKGKLAIKAKYRTPRARMQMLWARVVSDGVRAMCPQVNCGRYTPEEIDDIPGAASGNGEPEWQGARTPSQASPAPAEADEIVDVESEVAATEPTGPVDAAVEPVAGACSAAQSDAIKKLWGQLNAAPEQREKMLASRRVTSTRQLSADQANELIGKLAARLQALQADHAAADADTQKLCSVAQADLIRSKIKEVNQLVPGTVTKIKAKMAAAGLAKFEQLAKPDADLLLNALGGNQVEAFFGVSLWPTPTQGSAKN